MPAIILLPLAMLSAVPMAAAPVPHPVTEVENAGHSARRDAMIAPETRLSGRYEMHPYMPLNRISLRF